MVVKTIAGAGSSVEAQSFHRATKVNLSPGKVPRLAPSRSEMAGASLRNLAPRRPNTTMWTNSGLRFDDDPGQDAGKFSNP